MEEEIKEAQKIEAKEDDFTQRVKAFLVDLENLQKRSNILVRPIIGKYGPDLEFMDLTKVKVEEEVK